MVISVSWSGGIPSTGLVAGAIAGLLPKPDVAVFADTGAETESTYRTMEEWTPFVERSGIDVLRAPVAGVIFEDVLAADGHFANLPFYTLHADGRVGRLKRECTAEYKVRPIKRALRDYLGVKRRGRLAAGLVEQWLGYTREEVTRIHAPRVAWMTERYPWIDLGWYRFNVVEFLGEFCRCHFLPMPEPSACWMCPFRGDWWSLSPVEQRWAVDFDGEIRELPKLKAGGPVFLHRSCVPLQQVISEGEAEPPPPLQLEFAMECGSGYCEL